MSEKRRDEGKQAVRITTTIDAGTKRQLDAAIAERGMSRSEAVAQAIEEYVGRLLDQDEAKTTRLEALSEKIDRQAERLAKMQSETQLLSGMTLEALYHQFPPIDSLGSEELRRRAINRRRQR